MKRRAFLVWTELGQTDLSKRVAAIGATVLRPLPPGRFVVLAEDQSALAAVPGVERVIVDALERPTT